MNRATYAVSFFLVCAPACGEDEAIPVYDRQTTCRGLATLANIAGTWTLSGEGARRECDRSQLEGGFDIAAELAVTQTPNPTDPERDSLTAPNVPTGAFDGFVRGTCVTVTIMENDPRFGELVYNLRGRAEGLLIIGEFETTGPEDCTGNGIFSALIEP